MRYVITGSYTQAKDWISKDLAVRKSLGEECSTRDYRYVDDASIIRGVRNPRGVFAGTWKSRSDIHGIITQLLVATDENAPSIEVLRKIWLDVNLKE